ncbi:helix-turn-helix domain-containing protein [Endozoicomonadaceae bacterium StTr2]
MVSPPEPDSLIPEEHLMSTLAPLWRKRMETAFLYIRETLPDMPAPSWNEVAEKCGVSPFHFHRMFRLVFRETPGQYVRRIRLQTAISYLLELPDKTVTEIALSCGFSSSQALAKALKRDTGMTAKDIRSASTKRGGEVENLLLKLGHPENEPVRCMEAEIAARINFRVEDIDDFYLVSDGVKQFWPDYIAANHKKMLHYSQRPLGIVTQADDLGKGYDYQQAVIGYMTSHDGAAVTTFTGGRFLCCDVKIASETAYIALWDAIYNVMMQEGYELDPEGFGLEILHNPEAYISEKEPLNVTVKVKLRQII